MCTKSLAYKSNVCLKPKMTGPKRDMGSGGSILKIGKIPVTQ